MHINEDMKVSMDISCNSPLFTCNELMPANNYHGTPKRTVLETVIHKILPT
jgi:hypothetical protein